MDIMSDGVRRRALEAMKAYMGGRQDEADETAAGARRGAIHAK